MSRYLTLLPRLRTYVHDGWVLDEPTTIMGAARAMGETYRDGASANTPVFTLFDSLESAGIAVRAPELSSKAGRAIIVWNWSGLPIEGQTLRTALEPFLSAPVAGPGVVAREVSLPDSRVRTLKPVREEDRRGVKEAIRAVLAGREPAGAASRSRVRSDAALLIAATTVPAEEIRMLPAAARRLGTAKGSEHARRIRFLMRYAAAHDLVAVHVCPPQLATPWATWLHEHLPGEQHSNQRTWLHRLHDVLNDTYGNAAPATPEEMTIECANQALLDIASQRSNGKRAAAEVRSVLNELGHRKLGPYKMLAEATSTRQTTSRTVASSYVLGAGGDGVDAEGVKTTWDGMGLLLNPLPKPWLTFWEWFRLYTTLSVDELRKRWGAGFNRDDLRGLRPGVEGARMFALRHYIGAARTLLGLPTHRCTPQIVFGELFVPATAAIREAWAQRVAEQDKLLAKGIRPPGQRITSDSPTLVRVILNGGLIADSLVAWSRTERARGVVVATEADEAAWAASYEHSSLEAKHLAPEGLRGAPRTQKNIAEIGHDTPALALLPAALRRVERLVASAPNDRETMLAVQRYLIGSVIATGMDRVHELGLLEERHLKEHLNTRSDKVDLRYFMIKSTERKAGPPHEVPLLEELVPTPLWNYWMRRARPALVEGWLALGNNRKPHPYIFVSPSDGGPFGGAREGERGKDARRARNGAGSISEQFTAWRLEELRLQGFRVFVGSRGHHGPHAERARMTKLAIESGLEEARVTLLLGHTGDSTALRSYGASLATTNAQTLRKVLAARAWERSDTLVPFANQTRSGRKSLALQRHVEERSALLDEVQALVAKLDDISPREAVAELGRLWGRHAKGAGDDNASP